MDTSSADGSLMVGVGLAMALALLGGGSMSFSYLHNRTAAKERAALTTNLDVMENVDWMLANTDRLTVDLRAFLVTGDDQLSDEVIETMMALDQRVSDLQRLTSGNELQHPAVVKLERGFQRLFDLVGQSYEIKRLLGAPIALDLLDTGGAVAEVDFEATQVRMNAVIGILGVVRRQRTSGTVLEALF